MKTKRIPIPKIDPDTQAILIAGLNASPLSRLLRVAVEDMRKAKAKGRTLDMDLYTSGENGCACCMAGAVMLERCGSQSIYPFACAIDQARMGYIRGALDMLGRDVGDESHNAINEASDVIHAAFNPRTERAPMRVYLQAAKILEEAGL